MPGFNLVSRYKTSIDQKRVIKSIAEGVENKLKYQTLLGVTGSGKTFSMANVIAEAGKPALILTHNKTLAAQLYREFKEYFPDNAVEYFVSYYDYYQPEAYVPSSDLYIEKDASINDEIDRLRLKATSSLLDRDDVIVVSSVSCIYGLGSPENFEKMHIRLQTGAEYDRDELLRKLVSIYYERNDISFLRGTFRVRGDTVDVYPAYFHQSAFRVEFFGDEIDRISEIDPLSGRVTRNLDSFILYPAKHYVSPPDEMKITIEMIEAELESRLKELVAENKLVEAQRLESRTKYDVEMLKEMGYCNGIENYSRIVSRRAEGERPACLLDYFKGDYLMFIDESHVTIPQVGGMYQGDRSRKENLVSYGFRLPSALDNRPLYFTEFESMIDSVVFVSATPGDYELKKSENIVEQIIRPTGLPDPPIEIKPASTQIDDLISEVNRTVETGERVLVTALTKKMAEDLAAYFDELGIKTRYLHSEINTIERVEIIRDLRKGEFDCLIGINLLREGLDIPEVSLVAILDADKEGFLRAERSLIQTAGRAARNVNGRVIMYADKITRSIQKALDETERRRAIQLSHNEEHGITPESIKKDVVDIIEREYIAENPEISIAADYTSSYRTNNLSDLKKLKEEMREDMLTAAENLEFEKAAAIRDSMADVEKKIQLIEKVK